MLLDRLKSRMKCKLIIILSNLKGVNFIRMRIDIRQIAASIVAVLMLATIAFCCVTPGAYAAEEDEVDDGYTPSSYREANENINEWEDRVLIAAMDTLTSEGRVYFAYGDYVEELASYFAKDDLDLSQKDAKDAIDQIKDPANAKAGAQSGYLYQVGGKPKESDSLVEEGEYDGKVYAEFDKDTRYKNESEYRKSALYKNNKAYIDERTNTVYESKAAMREEMKQLAASDRDYQKIISGKPSPADIEAIEAPNSLGIAFMIIAIALLALTLVIIMFGWRKGTISLLLGMDDESWNRGNSRKDRHRIRKVSAILLAVVIALDLAVVYAGLAFHSTYGSNNFIEQAMDEAGICQHSYMDFRDDVHDFLKDQSLPQNSLDIAMTYRGYRFDYVKGTRAAIKDGNADVVYRGIQESVQAQIDLMAYVTKQDSKKVEEGVDEIYNDSLSTSVGTFVYKLRNSLSGPYRIGLIISVISLILATIMIVLERHNVYRGVGDLAVGALAGTVIWGAITALVIMMFNAEAIGFSDDAVYATNVMAANNLAPVILTILGISAVASILVFVTSKIMQKRS